MGRGGPLSGKGHWVVLGDHTAAFLGNGVSLSPSDKMLGGDISLVWAQGQLPAALAELPVCSHLSNPGMGLRMDPQDRASANSHLHGVLA